MVASKSEAGGEALAQRVGAAIAQHRKLAGFTQARVADAIGLEKETISRLENGVIAPTIFRLSQFAELFGCPVSALFGEYKGRVIEDAAAIAELLNGVSEQDRRTAMRVLADFVELAKRGTEGAPAPRAKR